jgi:hypothetical protein
MKPDVPTPISLFRKSLRAWQAQWQSERVAAHNRSETEPPRRLRTPRPRRARSLPA